MVLGDDVGRLWDGDTAEFVVEVRERLNGKGRFSPDGRWLVSEATAQIFEVETGRAVAARNLYPGLANCAVFSPDGSQLLVAGSDQTARLWNLAAVHSLPPPLRHDWALVRKQSAVEKSPHPTDPTQQGLLTLLHSVSMPAPRPAFTPDSGRLVTVSGNGSARVWTRGPANP